MTQAAIQTKNLLLIPESRSSTEARIARMPPAAQVHLSPACLALLAKSAPVDPWIHGFSMQHRGTGEIVGTCAFKGPPDSRGVVEIAYNVLSGYEGKGYATEGAGALVNYALNDPQVRVVCAHTLRERNASTHVLTKCGFRFSGEVVDPDDGPVWRWEFPRPALPLDTFQC